MKNKKVVVIGKMGPGTLEAKVTPLVNADAVERVYMIRETPGPQMEAVTYITLPAWARQRPFKWIIIPFLAIWTVIRVRAVLIVSYHVIPHGLYAAAVAAVTRRPFIISQTGYRVEQVATRRWLGRALAALLKQANSVNVPGTTSKAFWTKRGVPAENIRTLHSTVDPARFRPRDILPNYDYIFIGRLHPVKRVDRILSAVAILRNEGLPVRILVVGSGPDEARLHGVVFKLGLEGVVEFAGFQRDTELWLPKAKIFVMASEGEGLPVALLEAMAAGLTVVAPQVNNIPDVLRDGETGYAAFDCSPKGLARVMATARSRYELDASMRAAARELIVTRHSHAAAISSWNEVFLATVPVLAVKGRGRAGPHPVVERPVCRGS